MPAIPEVVGTMGQLPAGRGDADRDHGRRRTLHPARRRQSRLRDADHAVGARHRGDRRRAASARFPAIVGPHKEDICYATTNRQEAVKRVAPMVDAMIVVGAPNSSNSQRLKEVAERAGCPHAVLVQRAADIDWDAFGAIARARHHRRRLGAGSAGRGDHRRLCAALCGERRNRLRRRGGGVLSAAPPAAGEPGGGVTLSWPSIPTSPPTISPNFSAVTRSASCSPTRASPRAWRIRISWCTPAPAISFSRCTRSASPRTTCRSSSR